MTTLARELNHWRRVFDLTQERAGELLGVSRRTYIRMEVGGYVPSARKQWMYGLIVNAMFVGAGMQKDWGPL